MTSDAHVSEATALEPVLDRLLQRESAAAELPFSVRRFAAHCAVDRPTEAMRRSVSAILENYGADSSTAVLIASGVYLTL